MSEPAEAIVKVLAEGGAVTLWGRKTNGTWEFSRRVMDQTPELIDEPWIEHSSSPIYEWESALACLDEYPWHRLRPVHVHPEFTARVMEAVRARMAFGGARNLREWERLCSATSGTLDPPADSN